MIQNYSRALEPAWSLSLGMLPGATLLSKFGRNPDVDTGTLPEDLCTLGGAYTGFPTGTTEPLSIVSTSASDTGNVTVFGLRSTTSTSYQTETIALNGTTPVITSNSYYRSHYMLYNNSQANGTNLGTITAKHQTTTSNVFLTAVAGMGHSQEGVYTIPFSRRGLLSQVRIQTNIVTGSSDYVSCVLWIRPYGASPRMSGPLFSTSTSGMHTGWLAPVNLPSLTDITLRITGASANNLDITALMDFVLIEDI
jgi:hypothetical protein